MLYDAKCPVCGKLNKDMYLEETEGRFVCDKCGSEIEIPRFKSRNGYRYTIAERLSQL